MSSVKIQGSEYSLQKIFSNDFVFSIPMYQRPYAWTTEQAEELLLDIRDFMGNGVKSVEELDPYFLGSIVLIKSDNRPDAEVVDGQQRLTTLTILLAAIRESLESERRASAINKYIFEEGDELTNTPNRPRLTVRDRDRKFFRDHIQDSGGLETLRNSHVADLSDAKKNMRANALFYLDALNKLEEEQRFRLAQFIVMQCLLVVVSTPDLDSAYRIFSVLNDRGLDLSYTDILKAELIGKISETEQVAYAKKWEDLEEKLGRRAFEDVFAYIRTIYRKVKPQDILVKEIRAYVQPGNDPKRFINKVLEPCADAYITIKDASYSNTHYAEEINRTLRWLDRIDNSDWLPPTILFLSKHETQPVLLLKFLTRLERLAAGMMLYRANINQRINRYAEVLRWLDENKDLLADESPMSLSDEEQSEILAALDQDLYNPHIARVHTYVLLRLNEHLSDGTARYNFPVITVEHVLPQNPAIKSKWVEWFNNEEREMWVHRLANLVLLSRRKNNQASNYEFDHKKNGYFTGSGGGSPFPLTSQVIQESKWTPQVLEQRQKRLIQDLAKIWDLSY